jgi:ubiquinone/menaquinone biosynthesis C-methylase UbiE
MGVHDSAAKGYQRAAATYVSGRPDYPAEAESWLRDVVGLGPGKSALDLGAGTGKFVPMLEQTGARVLALEPVAAMRAELVRRHPDIQAMAGSAEAIPLPDASLDAVVCAQAFHWFATPGALSEIRRVLVPGGVLGLIWNVRDERTPWVAALSAITDPLEAGAPRYRTGEWRRVFPADGFEALEERRAPHAHVGPPEQVVVQRTLSVSFIAAAPPEVQRAVERQVRALIAATPELSRRSTVTFPYETRMYAFRKTS